MKPPFPAYKITTTGAPFYSVTIRPVIVLAVYETTGTAEIEQSGHGGSSRTYCQFHELASSQAAALRMTEKLLTQFRTSPDEKSAVNAMAGAGVV